MQTPVRSWTAARAGRFVGALAVASTVLLSGCTARQAIERRVREIHGSRVASLEVTPGQSSDDARMHARVVLGGTQRPTLAQACGVLVAMAERSEEGTVEVTYAITEDDGTSTLLQFSWSPKPPEIVLWEGRAPGPRGEGLATLFPVERATGVDRARLEDIARGGDVHMEPWPTQ